MVTFLHTADVQLGMRAREATTIGPRLREARFATLERLVALAVDAQVDFLAIAGDLFEDHQVHARTVSRAVQILQKASPIPVYILPGNHDPLDTGSIYDRPEFRDGQCGNLRVLRTPEPIPVGDHAVLYPCPLTARWSLADPTAWIPPRGADAETIRIGVAHGGVQTLRQDVEHPIPPDVALTKGLDYLALGDWHGTHIYDGNAMAYAGTPEQTRFGEERTGDALLVTISLAGARPSVEARRVGRLCWLDWMRPLDEPAEAALQQVTEEITALPNGANTLLRLTFTGDLRADALPLLDRFAVWLQARCENGDLLYAEYRNQTRSADALAGTLQQLTDGDPVLAGALADLQRLAETAPGDSNAEPPRDLAALLQSWQQTEPPAHLAVSAVAQQAIALLAREAMEVQ